LIIIYIYKMSGGVIKNIYLFPKVPADMGDYSWCRRQGGQRQGIRNPYQKYRTGLQGRSLFKLSQGGLP
jgi:hypothetical protein